MPIENDFDIPFVANLALREKQIQQNYRPVIAVHKWFARRPGTLFRGLLLSEFVDKPLAESFYEANRLDGVRLADPFMGGGTPLIEANRLGCDVVGYDINPMAYWVVRQGISRLDLEQYRCSADALLRHLESEIGALYRTRCEECGRSDAKVKYFLWVKVVACRHCGREIDLFPGYLIAKNQRHPNHVLLCPSCGELCEVRNAKCPGECPNCGGALGISGSASRSHCACPQCGGDNRFPQPENGPPRHRMFAIEYHCEQCKPTHRGRFFKKPDTQDIKNYRSVADRWMRTRARFIPDDAIPSGDETDRLHRWGYRRYAEMFNTRQLLGLELACRFISKLEDAVVREALATNLSDLLRYQNMLCRYDTMALKSLDIFSVHGFPVGLVQCESNMLGIRKQGGGVVGSGGWRNIILKYAKAKEYCQRPFEVSHQNGRKTLVHIEGEWIGDTRTNNGRAERRSVDLRCATATQAELEPRSLDAVLTDPPYFGNVQYAELMDFCYVWLKRLVGQENNEFAGGTTRHKDELTGNKTMGRGLEHFTDGLAAVFTRMAAALKPGAPLAFTYHHNRFEAYSPVAVAILDAGLKCSATIPCPAEMGASIHISGTGSSVVDTVFVCRSTGTAKRNTLGRSADKIAAVIGNDLLQLRSGGLRESRGDVRCITYGHLTRLAIWGLAKAWDRTKPVGEKLGAVAAALKALPSPDAVVSHLRCSPKEARGQTVAARLRGS